MRKVQHSTSGYECMYTTDKSAYRCDIPRKYVIVHKIQLQCFVSLPCSRTRNAVITFRMRPCLWIISSKMNISPSLGSGIYSGNKAKRGRSETKRTIAPRLSYVYVHVYVPYFVAESLFYPDSCRIYARGRGRGECIDCCFELSGTRP